MINITLIKILQIEKSPVLSPYKSTQVTLRASIPGVKFMKDECKRLLRSIDILMDTADAVKEDYWKSEKSKESLNAMQALLLDCQKLIVDCRAKKGGLFTNKNKWSKRFETLESQLDDFKTLLLVSYTHNIIIILSSASEVGSPTNHLGSWQ